MEEIRFNSAQAYLNFDFDDNYCFFFDEIKAVLTSIEKIDPDAGLIFDPEKEFSTIIKNLFKKYESLIIIPDEEKLFGEINGTKYLIKESKNEE